MINVNTMPTLSKFTGMMMRLITKVLVTLALTFNITISRIQWRCEQTFNVY